MSGAPIRFVGGNPSDEEVAVVTAVLVARAAAAARVEPARPSSSMWERPAHVRHGNPRTWSESRLPR